jgi:hypothetical protein
MKGSASSFAAPEDDTGLAGLGDALHSGGLMGATEAEPVSGLD